MLNVQQQATEAKLGGFVCFLALTVVSEYDVRYSGF